MVRDVRERCRTFKTPQEWYGLCYFQLQWSGKQICANERVCCALFRVGYIDTVRGPSSCAVDIKGLLKVVPEHGAGDKGSDYCIDGFAIDRYGELLTDRQQMYPDLCTPTIFVKTHQLVRVVLTYE